MNAADLAQRLAEARAQGRPAKLNADDNVPSVEDAYRVQSELIGRANNDVRGWKVTALAAVDQKKYLSSRPVAGAMIAPFTYTGPAKVSLSSFISPLLECEISFLLGKDLPAQRTPYTLDQISAAISAVVPAFELADCRVGGDAPGLMKLADAMGNGVFIAGQPFSTWQNLDLTGIAIALSHDGAVIEHGSSAKILGNPLLAVVALANAQPLPLPGLKAGHIVTTGTCTTPIEVHTGKYSADFGPLGVLEMTVVA